MASRVVKTSKGSNKSAELRGALKEGGIDSLSLYDLPGDSQGSVVFYFPLIVLPSRGELCHPQPQAQPSSFPSSRGDVQGRVSPWAQNLTAVRMQGWESRVWIQLGPTRSPQPCRGDGSAGSTHPCTNPRLPGFSSPENPFPFEEDTEIPAGLSIQCIPAQPH